LAVDDTHLYWATPGVTTTIQRTSLADGRSEVIFNMTPPVANGLLIYEMIVSGADLFAVTGSSVTIKRAVVTLPKDGSGPLVTLADDQHLAQNLAADAARVYWANSYIGGTIVACARTGCQGVPSVLASAQHTPMRVAVDDQNAYWLRPADDFSKGEILECPLTGCGDSPKRLAFGQETSPQSYIALDSGGVYWTDLSPLTLMSPGPYGDGDIRGVSK
jgi:hypothetical protein